MNKNIHWFFLMLMLAGVVQAQTFRAALTMIQPVSLAESTQMDLGMVRAQENQSCRIGSEGVRTGSACVGGESGSLAEIAVAGSVGQQIDIVLTGSSTADLSFVPSMVDNGNGSSALTSVSIQPAHKLLLGGEVLVSQFASASSVDYQVNVTYQ